MKITRLNVNGVGIPISFKNKKLLMEYLTERIKGAESRGEDYLNVDIIMVEIPDDVEPENEEQAVINAMTERRNQVQEEIEEAEASE